MGESLCVVQHRNDCWLHPKQGNFIGCGHWHVCCAGRRVGVLQRQHPKHFLGLGTICDAVSPRRHRQSADRHDVWRIVINRDRNAAVSRQILRFLAFKAAEEPKRHTFVHVADRCCLRPPVGAQRRNRHDPVLRHGIERPELLPTNCNAWGAGKLSPWWRGTPTLRRRAAIRGESSRLNYSIKE